MVAPVSKVGKIATSAILPARKLLLGWLGHPTWCRSIVAEQCSSGQPDLPIDARPLARVLV
jgi:hypothetical protein